MDVRMGQAKKGDGFWDFLPWALLGGAVGWGLYMALKPKRGPEPPPGETRAVPPAPVGPPSRYVDLASVDARAGQVRDLFRSGGMTGEQALFELDALAAAANTFGRASAADAAEARAVLARIAALQNEVRVRTAPLAGNGISAVYRVRR